MSALESTAAEPEELIPALLAEEYEDVPVPLPARRSLLSVASVWVGFPMVLTCALFGGLVVYNLGFWKGASAIIAGSLVLMCYVGALSHIAGASGKSFALVAKETFGERGHLLVVGFLSTVVIGWFALQTGMIGVTVATTMGWSERWTTVASGLGFVLVTMVGIRALTAVGALSAPLYLVLGAIAVALAFAGPHSDPFAYQGHVPAGGGALSFGAAVTLVVATFIDSCTMTADFTRWSRNGREGFLAAFAAFPVGHGVAMLLGGLVVALGAARNPAVDGGNFFGTLVAHGGLLVPVSVVFVFVNLGSVCTHCLYNGAVGWSQLTARPMRLLVVSLGMVGTALAALGVWTYFPQWLILLGVCVPPIGVVIILDQMGPGGDRTARGSRWPAFAAWAAGSAAAYLCRLGAPQLSEAVIGMAVAAVSFFLLTRISRSVPIATKPEATTA